MARSVKKSIPVTGRQEALQQSEERFRTLIQYSADAIELLSEDGTIIYASDSVQQVLGYTPSECVGSNFIHYIHPADVRSLSEKFQTLLLAPETHISAEYRVRHKNGAWVWIEATGSNYLHDPRIQAIIGNFRNIDERKRTELALQNEIAARQQAEERQRILDEASQVLFSAFDHHLTLQEVASMIVPALADYCRIAIIDSDRQIKDINVHHIDPSKLALVADLYENYKDRSASTHGLQKLLETGQPELISAVDDEVLRSIEDNPPLQRIVGALGLQSYMGVPLIARESIIGAITFSSIQPHRHYTLEDLTFAQELARRIALSLDNARLYQEAQAELSSRKQIEANLRFLSEASKILASSLDYQTTLTNVAHLAIGYNADWCAIEMLDKNGQLRSVAVAHKDPAKIQWARDLRAVAPPQLTRDTGIGLAMLTKQSGLYSDITDEMIVAAARSQEELENLRRLGMHSIMIVPILIQGEAAGTISFVAAESKKRYTDADVAMAEELAGRAALAIQNARLYAEAQQAIGLRDDFISIASHELKTPLTSLKMYTQVLQKQLARKGEETLSASLIKMDTQLNKLTMLIGDLLNVARIEHGQLSFQAEWFDLDELVKETVEQLQATTSKHTLSVEGLIEGPVWGDKDRIGQVLTNLLGNAIKYSPNGQRVIVSLCADQEEIGVSVQDFGIGIEPEHQEKVFGRFYRVSNPEEKTYPGLGIGLFLSYEIIRRHGGSLTVSSEKGKGSTFRFVLPRKAVFEKSMEEQA